MKCSKSGWKFIKLSFLTAKLFKIEFKKCGQILHAHKPHFLMHVGLQMLMTLHNNDYGKVSIDIKIMKNTS